MRGGLEVAACSESELLATPDIVPPQIVVLDDSSRRDAAHGGLSEPPRAAGARRRARSSCWPTTRTSTASPARSTRGASAYLVKPVRRGHRPVVHKITGWLTSRRPHREAPQAAASAGDAGRRGGRGGPPVAGPDGRRERERLPRRDAVGARRRRVVHVTLYGLEGSTDLGLGAEVRWQRPVPDGATWPGSASPGRPRCSRAVSSARSRRAPRHATARAGAPPRGRGPRTAVTTSSFARRSRDASRSARRRVTVRPAAGWWSPKSMKRSRSITTRVPSVSATTVADAADAVEERQLPEDAPLLVEAHLHK